MKLAEILAFCRNTHKKNTNIHKRKNLRKFRSSGTSPTAASPQCSSVDNSSKRDEGASPSSASDDRLQRSSPVVARTVDPRDPINDGSGSHLRKGGQEEDRADIIGGKDLIDRLHACGIHVEVTVRDLGCGYGEGGR